MSLDPSDLVDKNAYAATPHDPLPEKTLIWHRIEGRGQRPAARTLHSMNAANDGTVYVFGGMTAGRRSSALLSLDITTSTWAQLKPDAPASIPALGPCPRALHAACMVGGFLLVHGGEGDALPTHTPNPAPIPCPNPNPAGSASSVLSTPAPNPNPAPATGGVSGDRIGLKLKASQRIVHAQGAVAGIGAEADTKNAAIAAAAPDPPTPTRNPNPNSTRDFEGESRSLEDLWAFSPERGEWQRIACSLAPLPRKGHTLSLAPLGADLGEGVDVGVGLG